MISMAKNRSAEDEQVNHNVSGLLFGFKFLLCQKLSENIKLDYSEVMSPVFILLQLVMIRACQLH
jgi:hypothetical protein